MKTKDLIQGNVYNYYLKFPTDLYMIYIGTEDVYTYFDFETKYVFEMYVDEIYSSGGSNKSKLIYLSETSVQDYVTKNN